jgi:hypothetical protein
MFSENRKCADISSDTLLIHLWDSWMSDHIISADKGNAILDGVKEVKGDELPFRLQMRGCSL